MADPNYVRLANRLSRGMLADVQGTGWSIAGLDVKEFPEGNAAQKFVRAALNNGKLEPASKSEFEDAHEGDEALLEAMLDQHPDFGSAPQEAKVRRAHQKVQRTLEEKRGDKRSSEERYDEEVRQPRQARAAGDGSVSSDALDDMSKAELQEQAEALGLSVSGNKDEIKDRILEAQSSSEEEGGEE